MKRTNIYFISDLRCDCTIQPGYYRYLNPARLIAYLPKIRVHLSRSNILTTTISNRQLQASLDILNMTPRNDVNRGRRLPAPNDDHSPDRDRLSQALAINYYSNFCTHTISAIFSSLKWTPTSDADLEEVERELLAVLSRPARKYFVDIGEGWTRASNRIRTIEMLTDDEIQGTVKRNKRYPLVLVHGFAAGIGAWILNLDELVRVTDRKVFAFDVIGFGRSARAPFDLSSARQVEEQFVESIERWRRVQKIDRFILLGHSFGGYLVSCYALKHPERVAKLILVDPWGVMERPQRSTNAAAAAANNSNTSTNNKHLPFWVSTLGNILTVFNPLFLIRATGRAGPILVRALRKDLKEKFRPKLQQKCVRFLDYLYHCNAQRATGESAFKTLEVAHGWPKLPLVHRLINLDEAIFVTLIYGARTWTDSEQMLEQFRECLSPGRVTFHRINGAGHHVYADKYKEFNDLVAEACRLVER